MERLQAADRLADNGKLYKASCANCAQHTCWLLLSAASLPGCSVGMAGADAFAASATQHHARRKSVHLATLEVQCMQSARTVRRAAARVISQHPQACGSSPIAVGHPALPTPGACHRGQAGNGTPGAAAKVSRLHWSMGHGCWEQGSTGPTVCHPAQQDRPAPTWQSDYSQRALASANSRSSSLTSGLSSPPVLLIWVPAAKMQAPRQGRRPCGASARRAVPARHH